MRPLVTLYTCFCEFEDGQWSFCCDLTDFDAACDSYIEARDGGAAAGVWSRAGKKSKRRSCNEGYQGL